MYVASFSEIEPQFIERVHTVENKLRVWKMFRSAPPPLGYDPAMFFAPAENPDTGLLKLTPWRIELVGVLKDSPSDKENKVVWRR